MADEEKIPFEDEQEEEDLLFKAQMKVYDLVLGYWQQGVGVILAGLAVVLVIGLWQSQVEKAQMAASAEIAEVDREQPPMDQLAALGLVPRDDLNDPERVALLTDLATRYEAVAGDSNRAGAATAWLKAADAWKRLGETDKAAAAYQGAIDASDDGLLGYAARNGLAAIHMKGDRAAEAQALYRASADANDGILGERALLDLGLALESGGDAEKARETYEEFKLRFPESPRLLEAEQRLSELGSAGG